MMNVYETYLDINKSSEEDALLYLYKSLIEFETIEECEEFLKSVPIESTNTDCIVHILNALSTRKHLISNWDECVSKFKERFIELEGEKDSEILMSVIL